MSQDNRANLSAKQAGALLITFPQAVANCFHKYTVWNGRAPRLEYAWFFLFSILCSLGVDWLDGFLETPPLPDLAPLTSTDIILTVALFLPSIAVMVRRLHDYNYSAGWVLLILVPVVNIIFWFCLLLVKGDTAANRFGEPPSAKPPQNT